MIMIKYILKEFTHMENNIKNDNENATIVYANLQKCYKHI